MFSLFEAKNRLKEAEKRLHQVDDELRIAATLFQTLESVMITNARGVILRINEAFTRNTGYTPEEIVGKTPWILRSGHHDEAFYAAMRKSIAETGNWQGEIWDRRKDGEVFPKWLTIASVPNADGNVTHMVATYIDITEKKRAEERINQLALYDVLTQLPNRIYLQELLQQAINNTKRSQQYGAVLWLDLDNLRRINDSLGYNKGDEFLQKIALRLKAAIPDTASLARLGGDDFIIVLQELCESETKAALKAEQIAVGLQEQVSQAILLGEQEYRCSASIGITLFQYSHALQEELLQQAELAKYKAKKDGRNTLHFFDKSLEETVKQQLVLERDLNKAITDNQLSLYYQAQIKTPGQLVAAEALVRWSHPERGIISPAHFIPFAEESGQIVALGNWILAQSCRQLGTWAKHPNLSTITLAVNVSALQFNQPHFVDTVKQVLAETKANPAQLKLELTESLLVNNAQAVIDKMLQLKALGVQISLDDFGTGYSSLSYLKQMPLDQLKIDQSFVRDALTDRNAAAIAESIATLAQSLGLAVVAEGVETQAQADFLNGIGCTVQQGYLYSKPLPLEAFEEWAARKE